MSVHLPVLVSVLDNALTVYVYLFRSNLELAEKYHKAERKCCCGCVLVSTED